MSSNKITMIIFEIGWWLMDSSRMSEWNNI